MVFPMLVSLVDGFDIPMAVTNSGGCSEASCPVDLNANCNTLLRVIVFRDYSHFGQAQVNWR